MEALVLCLALSFLIQALFLLFWTAVSFIFIEHQLYQGVLCAVRGENPQSCKSKVLARIRKFHPVGKTLSIKINTSQKGGKGLIQWRFLKTDFFIKQTVQLPY